MKKYTLTIELIVLAESDEDAKQKGFNIAKNEREKYDNGCTVSKIQKWASPVELYNVYSNL